MLPLLNAIYASFTADSALTAAFPGGLHRDQAPEGTAMPYVVSTVVSSTTGLAYNAGSRSATHIKFTAFAAAPMWAICIPLLFLSHRWIGRTLRQRRRAQHGLCLQCGYDLRGPPLRCPECGHMPATPRDG